LLPIRRNDVAIVRAPFTADQVEALNVYQKLGFVHEYTCGGMSCRGVLVAERSGWRCPVSGCNYTQEWAEDFTTDLKLHPKHPFPNYQRK
jgi:hypothetical protein